MVCTAGGKDSVVLSDTSCTCEREIEGSGGGAGRGHNERVSERGCMWVGVRKGGGRQMCVFGLVLF